MKKLVLIISVLIMCSSNSMIALAGYDDSHDHHEHHASKSDHEAHVGAIREAIGLLENSHPDLAKRLEKVADHHENL